VVKHIAYVGAIAALACGCVEVKTCPAGNSYVGGSCMPLSGQDTGIDASADGGTDAFVADAGPCAACTPDQHCRALEEPDAGPRDGGVSTAGNCVQCITDHDCDPWFMMLADGGVDGGRAAGRGLCVDYVCHSGCTEAGDCGGNLCGSNGQCTAYFEHAQMQCMPCDVQENCAPGFDCIPMTFGPTGSATAIGSYCLQPFSAGACPEPYTVPVSSHCGVNQMLTTCDAVREFTTMCAAGSAASCGRDDILDDGVCGTIAGLSGLRCTYACELADPTTCIPTRPCGATAPHVCGGT
jgi:hypothetical protein